MYTLSLKRMIDDLARKGISDSRVLAVMGDVPRHLFVEEALRMHAFSDKALPIGAKQTISKPWTVALMTSLLDVAATDRVLEIGTGSGYQAAVLARLCAHLFTIERIKRLYEQAGARLKTCGIFNVSFLWGDGREGWPERAPFDRIVLTAASPDPPFHLLDQLADGGRLLSPVKTPEGQRLILVVRHAKGKYETRDCGGCEFVPLLARKVASREPPG